MISISNRCNILRAAEILEEQGRILANLIRNLQITKMSTPEAIREYQADGLACSEGAQLLQDLIREDQKLDSIKIN